MEQELVPVLGHHSLVVRDKDLDNLAGDFLPAQMHHSVEEGNLSACQAEVGVAAGVQEGLVAPVVLKVGGCSEPLRWEASELLEEEALSGRGMVGKDGAAVVGVALGPSTGQKQLRLEEGQEEEKTQAERKEGALEMGRSLEKAEVGLL